MGTHSQLNRLMIEAMARHLPPSASSLRLLDVNGEATDTLTKRREDLSILVVPGNTAEWPPEIAEVDAVVAFAYMIHPQFLERTYDLMRPGGRLIVVDPRGEVRPEYVNELEAYGYTRILVETAVECPLPTGVLIRGEKPHATNSTLDRVQVAASRDADQVDIADFKGRYLHLLIQESPNKPVWSRTPEDNVSWKAAVIPQNGQQRYLAFSSLPKAVAFMQPAVLEGKIQDVNKVGKFRKSVALNWELPVLLNPSPSVLNNGILWLEVDPSTAEASDE
jgi:hypothetical protein